ncbi:hypothetical protein KK137_06370 [Croceibacterium sp. LX-88]|uniref:Uncharacterized protein n=1 Tax=Croceibacterium selenioxidans TaxID=2838833 RepID=A0ABS5W2S0_9SPHN|nr:hypothetical protein [Croceibacterium selenioxidans]MBT2133954.1 hypothetical protein [Croceibacterium selenioxidans]
MTFLAPLNHVSDEERRRRSRVLEDGEYARFDVTMRDGASRSSVFLTDTQKTAIESNRALRDMVRDAQYTLPDRCVLQDGGVSTAPSSGTVLGDSSSRVRDLARAQQYGG